MNRTKDGVEVRVGQVWRDCDKRMQGDKRRLKVVRIAGDVAVMVGLSGAIVSRETRVSIRRMHKGSRGWEMVQ